MAQEPGLPPPTLENLRPLDAPKEIAAAADVRWQADGGLLVGLSQEAIRSWRPGTLETRPVVTLAGTMHRRAARYGNYSRLGGGPLEALVFAGDLFGVYRRRRGRIEELKANLEIVGDLDHQGGWTVAVGLSRLAAPSSSDTDGVWEPYIAWLFDTEGGVRGLVPTRDGGAALDSCYPVELSVSRFVADDLVLVVPGAEPGAYLYGKDGLLRGAVDLEALSASRPECGPREKALLYEEEFRRGWLTRHRIIDEVAANGEGDIFFFVRHAEGVALVPSDPRNGNTGKDAAGRGSAQVGDGNPTVVAVGLDSLPDHEPEELLEQAESAEGFVVLEGDRAAQLLAAVDFQDAGGDGSSSFGSSVSSAAKARVCWDIVHARVEDLSESSIARCVVESNLADARLRVDLSGDRAILLIRGATRLASGGVTRPRPTEFFEARLRAGH